MHRLRRSLVTLVAGTLLVLVSAGACDDGTTGPGTEPQPGSTVAPGDDDDGRDDSSGPGDDSEGPGDDGPSDDPSDDADEAEGADDGGVSGRGDSSDN